MYVCALAFMILKKNVVNRLKKLNLNTQIDTQFQSCNKISWL